MRAALVMLILVASMMAGCASPGAVPQASAPALSTPVERQIWVNASVGGTFTGYAVPPATSGALPEGSTVHKFEIKNAPGNVTTLLRLTLASTPAQRSEYYIAHPECKEPEVSDCRSDKYYKDRDQRIYEVPKPEPGQWRFVVYGSGLGVSEVKYTVKIEVERTVLA